EVVVAAAGVVQLHDEDRPLAGRWRLAGFGFAGAVEAAFAAVVLEGHGRPLSAQAPVPCVAGPGRRLAWIGSGRMASCSWRLAAAGCPAPHRETRAAIGCDRRRPRRVVRCRTVFLTWRMSRVRERRRSARAPGGTLARGRGTHLDPGRSVVAGLVLQ